MAAETFLDGKVTLHRGDCLEVLPLLEADSIDSCVTDPPYHLTSVGKPAGKDAQTNMTQPADKDLSKVNAGSFRRLAKGFMGKQWDGGDIAFRPELWVEVLRVLKPGAHLIAFGGTRTYHRMACAIEDAGFEIRDQIGWCYGSGFPKSHDVSKGIDRLAGAEREIVGEGGFASRRPRAGNGVTIHMPAGDPITAPTTDSAIQWQGWGTALKPAWEPCVLARKPLSESSIAANVLKHGTGGINVDGCRIPTDGEDLGDPTRFNGQDKKGHEGWMRPHKADDAKMADKQAAAFERMSKGRWPANLIHDGSEEVLAGFPETPKTGAHKPSKRNRWFKNSCEFDEFENDGCDSGSAARFFYTAKADTDDRLGSKHPTVKPLALIQYLVRLITPVGGLVLDPFAGTGTCGEAAFRGGAKAILVEREAEYQADIVKRMGLCLSGADTRRASSVKQESAADLPLFGGVE